MDDTFVIRGASKMKLPPTLFVELARNPPSERKNVSTCHLKSGLHFAHGLGEVQIYEMGRSYLDS